MYNRYILKAVGKIWTWTRNPTLTYGALGPSSVKYKKSKIYWLRRIKLSQNIKSPGFALLSAYTKRKRILVTLRHLIQKGNVYSLLYVILYKKGMYTRYFTSSYTKKKCIPVTLHHLIQKRNVYSLLYVILYKKGIYICSLLYVIG